VVTGWSATVSEGDAATTKKVKVFVLAGQSNMEGKASNGLLEKQAVAPETKDLYKHLRKDGKWIVRDDVFVKFLKRKGSLTIGFGSPGRTGPELEFGVAMGNHFDQPVLLIKTAWGGHDLRRLFRSPSAGFPTAEVLQAELSKAQERVKKDNKKNKRNNPLPTMEDIKKPYGMSYRNMIAEVKDVFDNHETMFPEFKGTQLEMAGFVWFQGFNDMLDGTASAEYASNMEHFIRDVRKDLKSPKLPFVIAVIGNNGSKPARGGMLKVQNAQLSMSNIPDFKGNVKAFRTDVLVDKKAEELFPNWAKHHKEWIKVASDGGYHYYGSGIWYNRIGKGMAKAMLELLPRK